MKVKSIDSYTIKVNFLRKFNFQKSIVTPLVIRYGKQGNYIYELSTNDEIEPQFNCFNVTVLHAEHFERRFDLSKMFKSRIEAENYIKTLKRVE